MDSVRIDTGVKRLMVNGDESRVIEFNPEDIVFVERFYGLIKGFEEKADEYAEKAKALRENNEVDSMGIPVNAPETIALVADFCNYLRGEIDKVFGEGTSEKAFGSAQTMNMFEQFFDGITPYIRGARAEKVDKYKKSV